MTPLDSFDPSPAPRKLSTSWPIALLVAAIAAFHLLMTAVYLGPPNLAKLQLQDLALRYMDPVFQQNWHLFSPMPAIGSTKLPIRCQQTDGTWTPWVDPLEDLYVRHYRSRISGHGKLLLFYRDLGADLNDMLSEQSNVCLQDREQQRDTEEGLTPTELADPNACSLQTIATRLIDEPHGRLASRFAHTVCSDSSDGDYSSAQYKVMDFVPVPYSQRQTATARWGSVREVPFPATKPDGTRLPISSDPESGEEAR